MPRARLAAAAAAALLLAPAAPNLPRAAAAEEAAARGGRELPRPPCDGAAPVPAYAAPDAAPAVGVWAPEPLDEPGLPHVRLHVDPEQDALPGPPCTGWDDLPFTVALATRFRHDGGAEELLGRVGAVSELARQPYWRARRQDWEPLFDEAYAVRDAESRERRDDFRPEELRAGGEVHAFQDAAGPVGGAIFRTRVGEAGPERVVVEIENVTSARALGLFPLAPGTFRSLYVLERLPGENGTWGYYNLVGIRTVPDTARTYVNRAAAVARFLTGTPATLEPPVWP